MKCVRWLVLGMVILLATRGPEDARAEERVHPRNQMLISKGLVPKDILKYFPDVPKIAPIEALSLYRSKKAVFIGIGLDVPRLPDGWLLKDYMAFDPRKLAGYKIPTQGVIIVLYCG